MKSLEKLDSETIDVATSYNVYEKSIVWLDDDHIAMFVVSGYTPGNYYTKLYIKIYTVSTTGGTFSITETDSNNFQSTTDNTLYDHIDIIKLDDGKLAICYEQYYQATTHYLYVETFTYNTSTFGSITSELNLNFETTTITDMSIASCDGPATNLYVIMLAYCTGSGGDGFLSTFYTNCTSSIAEIDELTVTSDNTYKNKILNIDQYNFILTYSYESSGTDYVKSQVYECTNVGDTITANGTSDTFGVSPLAYDVGTSWLDMTKTTSNSNYMVIINGTPTGLGSAALLVQTLAIASSTYNTTYDSNPVSVGAYTHPNLTRVDDTTYALGVFATYWKVVLIGLDSTTITANVYTYSTNVSSASSGECAVLATDDGKLLFYAFEYDNLELLGSIAIKIRIGGASATWRRVRSMQIRIGGATPDWEYVGDLQIRIGGATPDWEDVYH